MKNEQLINALVDFGFTHSDSNSKTWKFELDDTVVFVKVDTLKQPLVVHPDNLDRWSELENITGVHTAQPVRYYHNSTMRAFPSRLNTGQDETKYGLAIGVETNAALRQLLVLLTNTKPNSILEDLDEIEQQDLTATEKSELRNTRIGQSRFRADLIEDFNGTCPCTGIHNPRLLRASHIKPWAASTNHERLDKDNGILLAANVDALFDQGYISFKNDGRLMVSKRLQNRELRAFGLDASLKINAFSQSRSTYLQYHREKLFKDS